MSVEDQIYNFASKIYPIHRHLMGDGVRDTLNEIKKINKNLKIYHVPTGTKFFDWQIPNEWKVKEAYIEEVKSNKKIIDIKNNNLHILQYSTNVNKIVSKKELLDKLHYIKKLPNAIPYKTSYYKKDWGFCVKYNDLKKLNKKKYRVVINSKLFSGFMNYGEILLPGKSKKEILLTSYICHPSMANNEVSGPSLLTYIAKYLYNQKKRKYSYRIIFIPETLGSIYYIYKNLNKLKKNLIFGINLSCVGDNGTPSIVKSLHENTLADRIFNNIFKFEKKYNKYNYLNDRGSDERQFNLPNVNLPLITFCKSKFNTFKQYHTSLDDLKFVSKKGFKKSYEIVLDALNICQNNTILKCKTICEPFFENKPNSNKLNKILIDKNYIDENQKFRILINIVALSDGKKDLIEISNRLNIRFSVINQFADYLLKINAIIKI